MIDYNPSDIYMDYINSVRNPLPYKIVKELSERFNEEVMNKVIYEGRPFEMGSFLSVIQVVRRKRDPKKKVPNWKLSRKVKEELIAEGKELYNDDTGKGYKWLVYYTDSYYCRFYWSKWHCRVPNKGAYRFTPSRGIKGVKTKLKKFLRKDDLNYKTFKEYKVN